MKIKTIKEYSKPVFILNNGDIISYASGVRRLRRKKDLNTKDFGELIGVSAKTIENWEQVLRFPSRPALLLMKQLLK